jgi:hypothetical protein
MKANIIFQIDGGIGKSIMATAVCEAIKKQYPKDNLIVISAYPEVFICNPNVDKCLSHNNLNYFYQDFIEGQKVKAFLHNPYFETSHIQQECHLIQTWCEMFGVKYNREMPKIYLSNREINFYSTQYQSEKPIMVLQTNGGGADQPLKYSWMRDIPNQTAQEVVNHFAKEYNVVHLRREDQLQLQNTTPVSADFRSLAVLIKLSTKRLFIDSFAQHTAKALDMNSVVCWIGNKSSVFGYESNINIQANKETAVPELKQSVFSKYNITGNLFEFPYEDEKEIFNTENIINALTEL